jgi:NHLM bacteriocin system ABC transporter peptidase/ATP-binding protein
MSRRARTSTVFQLEATECGAASLAMVLGYFGRFVPLDELRTLCGVSRDGAKASSVLRAARGFGLEARGLRAEPAHLIDIRGPMIAFVNFNHFVVVEGADDRFVWINDPAAGPRRETMAAFSESFTGVVLTFARGDAFVPGDSRPRLLASLAGRFAGLRTALGFLMLASLALVVPGIVLPVFSRIFVDYVLVRGMDDWLGPLLIGMALTALARILLIRLQTRTLTATRVAMTLATGRGLMTQLMRLPIAFFEQRFAGEIADRVRLNETLSDLLTGRLALATANLIAAAFFFVAMLFYHWPLALGVLLLTFANIAVLAASTRALSDLYRKIAVDQGKLMGARVAGLKDMETFKASGAEDLLFARWLGLAALTVNGRQRAASLSAWIAPLPKLVGALSVALVLVGGGFAVMAGDLTIGELVAFQTLAASFSAPLAALAGFGAEAQQVGSYAGRLNDILNQQADPRFRAETEDRPEDRPKDWNAALPRGRLTLAEVSFGYAPLDPPLIDRLDLEVNPGERIALVGASGSGKSTLGKIVAGLETPRQGACLIDGLPLADWPRAGLAQRLAYVAQQVRMFEGSVRDNLSLWDAALPDADIIRAARDARIHDVIAARPGGYDARIAEGGVNFSGGERQRLEIARALATDPTLLILDEATSALDPVTELQVLEAIRRRGMTCILIAHRLSAIRDCDQIVVLDRGRIVERGTHRALIGADGRYARLIEA